MLTEGHRRQTASHGTVPAEPEKWSLRSGRKQFPAAGPAGSDSPAEPLAEPLLRRSLQMDPGIRQEAANQVACVCTCVHAYVRRKHSCHQIEHTLTSILEITKLRLGPVK